MIFPLLVLATVFAFVLIVRIIESRSSLGLIVIAAAAIVASERMVDWTSPSPHQTIDVFASAANADDDAVDATESDQNDDQPIATGIAAEDTTDDDGSITDENEPATTQSASDQELSAEDNLAAANSDSPTTEEVSEESQGSLSTNSIPVATAPKIDSSVELADVSDITIESNRQYPIIPDGRPEWVEQPANLDGEVHRIAVSSGPLDSMRHSRRELDEELRLTMEAYIDDYLGKVYGDKLKASNFVSYDIEDIKHRLVKPDKTYSEIVEFSVGPMHQSHALLEIDASFRKELDGHRADLDRQWREMVATSRLFGSGLGIAFVICLLAVVFGYFKLDTATRGYYTGSLRFVAAATILGLIVSVALLALRIDWM